MIQLSHIYAQFGFLALAATIEVSDQAVAPATHRAHGELGARLRFSAGPAALGNIRSTC
jgi:hypothetical protein